MEKKVVKNFSRKMASVLPKDIMRLLKDIGVIANSLGYSAFVVGGLVRDALLGAKNLDLDIVVEGDAIKLGHTLSKKIDAALAVHRRFGTCTVITKDRLKIDIATARKEVYLKPAALPIPESSCLKDDLARRDFTINAMAISINQNSFGQLIDFYGGEQDLHYGRIKVMHDKSFIDDPTRMFRAIRFETRLGFYLDGRTLRLLKKAARNGMPAKVSRERIRNELILVFKEKNKVKPLKRLAELDVLRFVHPELKFGKGLTALLISIEENLRRRKFSGFSNIAVDEWLIYLMALFDTLSYNATLALCNSFSLRREDKSKIMSLKNGRGLAISKKLSQEAMIFTMAKSKEIIWVRKDLKGCRRR
ncbi:MAG: hypothetical protein Q8Q87_04495 [Candidatus Omnitrophota bacterium]|nr:hypothetical protein [Candidatus Omnitrophota bacterium]